MWSARALTAQARAAVAPGRLRVRHGKPSWRLLDVPQRAQEPRSGTRLHELARSVAAARCGGGGLACSAAHGAALAWLWWSPVTRSRYPVPAAPDDAGCSSWRRRVPRLRTCSAAVRGAVAQQRQRTPLVRRGGDGAVAVSGTQRRRATYDVRRGRAVPGARLHHGPAGHACFVQQTRTVRAARPLRGRVRGRSPGLRSPPWGGEPRTPRGATSARWRPRLTARACGRPQDVH